MEAKKKAQIKRRKKLEKQAEKVYLLYRVRPLLPLLINPVIN